MATRRTLYCLAHGQPACHSCRTQQKGSQHCCALSHHQGFSPRKYRRRPRDPGGPPTPDDGDGGAQTSGMVHVISDDSGGKALDTPPLADVGTASATTTRATSTTMQAYKRPRTIPLAAPSPWNPVLSTSPGTLMVPNKWLRAVNRGEAMGADSPLLARPRAGSFGQDPRIKRHRGDGRTSLPQHENAILEQELAPVFHQSFSSSTGTDVNPQLPLAGAGRARQLAPPSGHGRASESNT